MGDNDRECPVFCPAKCNQDEMQCPGGKDSVNCPVTDFCRSTTSKIRNVKIFKAYFNK